jgi:KDO2-lipid IV(A) lauroyltransferase
MLKAQWDGLGRTFAEFPLMDKILPSTGRVEVVNQERLFQIAADKVPVVFVSGHLSNWEVMPAAIVDSGVVCEMTYRAANNPYVDERIKASRFRYGVRLFAPKGGDGARELLEGMKQGKSVALMNDQKFNTGVEGLFFGHPVRTAPGPSRLAIRFGTVLQPMSVQRIQGRALPGGGPRSDPPAQHRRPHRRHRGRGEAGQRLHGRAHPRAARRMVLGPPALAERGLRRAGVRQT